MDGLLVVGGLSKRVDLLLVADAVIRLISRVWRSII